jgi:alpha-beta hydrolase superfamily lysophospholipase
MVMKKTDFGFQTVDGLKLAGCGWLPEATPRGLICLIHGLGEHSGRYRHLADRLVQSGYGLWGFDLRGHGLSQGQRGQAPGLPSLMDDISRFLDEIGKRLPDTPQFLYGHSLGGTLAINFVLRMHPEMAGVIVTAPFFRPAFKPPFLKLLIGKGMDRLWPTLSLPNGIDPTHLARDPEVARAYTRDALVHDRLSARLGIEILKAGLWAIEHASEFTLPLLLMQGGADHIVSAEACREFAAKAGAHCDFKLWDGCYHELHNEPEKAAVFDFLLEWLNRN